MCVLSWHGGVDVNKIGVLAGVGAALVILASTAVLALEEQKGAAPQEQSAPADAAKVQDGGPIAKPETGTEIRIPGLGKLGTLPKMDFGLELLYGATDGKPQPDVAPQDTDQGDLTIRGSVKHRF